MPERVRLPGASELFRTTQPSEAAQLPDQAPAVHSGRVRHDEKITVYLSSDELMAVEQARLLLRREVNRSVDRGRLVRAAIAMALADFAEHGDESQLAARLRDS